MDAQGRCLARLGCQFRRRCRYPACGQERLASASSEGGLSEINSIGVISHDGQQLVVAVLSSGYPSESDGSQVVQAAVSAVTGFQRPQAKHYSYRGI